MNKDRLRRRRRPLSICGVLTAAIASLHEFELRFDDNHPGAVFELVGRAW